MIYLNIKRFTKKAKSSYVLALSCLFIMVCIDWSEIGLYLYQNSLSDVESQYYIGNIVISMTDLHSILASLLFEQFKGMILSQVEKPNRREITVV
ncbi:hypothetical protein HDV04_001082 [Boothiomyces sp. JEL0838]|nr:hypothetical protein HDV04_001082 [Boothiomyces sp. JEL0838]